MGALMAELLAEGDALEGGSAAVELEWLQLEKLRLERDIEVARRTDPMSVGPLAVEREAVKCAIDDAAETLEEEIQEREASNN